MNPLAARRTQGEADFLYRVRMNADPLQRSMARLDLVMRIACAFVGLECVGLLCLAAYRLLK